MKNRFSPNQRQLSKALGVSRQLVAYHTKQEGSPKACDDGRHDVSAWRVYLSEIGRKGIKPDRDLPLAGFNMIRIVAERAAEHLFHALTAKLPEIVTELAGAKLSQKEREEFTTSLWYELATGLAFYLRDDRFSKYAAKEFGGSLDAMWRQCGHGDTTQPPRTINVPVAATIIEAFKSRGINVDEWIEFDPAKMEKEAEAEEQAEDTTERNPKP
jgi:hypothetical protein